ncbi:unnamed protein product [Arctogadus glacialis]
MVTLFPKPAFGVFYPGNLQVGLPIPVPFPHPHGGLSTGVFSPSHGMVCSVYGLGHRVPFCASPSIAVRQTSAGTRLPLSGTANKLAVWMLPGGKGSTVASSVYCLPAAGARFQIPQKVCQTRSSGKCIANVPGKPGSSESSRAPPETAVLGWGSDTEPELGLAWQGRVWSLRSG